MRALAFLPSPAHNGLHVGPLFVHAYGLAYVVAVLAAVAITTRRWEALGGRRELVQEVALWGFPAGLVGGRLYHLATSWNEVPHHWWGPFAIWKGGLGIWGGIAAGTLAGLWVLRQRRADLPAFMDTAAPGLLVAQAIGRVGNYFNQELFGGPTDLPWGLQIDPTHRPPGYERFATFHPTFLYELLWNLALAGALVWLGRRGRIRAPSVRALRRRLLARADRRRALACRSRPPPLRAAPELLRRHRAVSRRAGVVRSHTTPDAATPRPPHVDADRAAAGRSRAGWRTVRLRAGRARCDTSQRHRGSRVAVA